MPRRRCVRARPVPGDRGALVPQGTTPLNAVGQSARSQSWGQAYGAVPGGRGARWRQAWSSRKWSVVVRARTELLLVAREVTRCRSLYQRDCPACQDERRNTLDSRKMGIVRRGVCATSWQEV